AAARRAPLPRRRGPAVGRGDPGAVVPCRDLTDWPRSRPGEEGGRRRAGRRWCAHPTTPPGGRAGLIPCQYRHPPLSRQPTARGTNLIVLNRPHTVRGLAVFTWVVLLVVTGVARPAEPPAGTLIPNGDFQAD